MSKFKKGTKLTFGKKIENIMKKEKAKGGSSDLYFSPQLGENIVRIIPYIHDETNWPFFTTYTHWRINGENLLSPKTYQQKDPFIDLASEIWNNESISESDRKTMFKRLMPQESTYCTVIVRGEDETKVKLWRVPNSARDQIYGYLNDPDTDSLIDPYDGIDIVLTKTQDDLKDYRTIKYIVRLKRSNTAIGTDEQLEKIFNTETFPKFEDVWKLIDTTEYNKKFEAFVNGDKVLNQTPTQKVEETVQPKVENKEESKSNINDTLAKFKSMVNK